MYRNSMYSQCISMSMCHRFRTLAWIMCKKRRHSQLNVFVHQEILLNKILIKSEKGKIRHYLFFSFLKLYPILLITSWVGNQKIGFMLRWIQLKKQFDF